MEELDDIAAAIKQGVDVPPVSTRTFIGWFGAERRGSYIVALARYELAQRGLRTIPDFTTTWLDSPIAFAAIKPVETEDETGSADEETTDNTEEDNRSADRAEWISTDPAYRLSKLEAANQPVIAVQPDTPLSEIVTTMMLHDFSQLPVTTGERSVKGVVSWRSIGLRASLGRPASTASDAMDSAQELPGTATIFEAIPIIGRHDYVIVRGPQNQISGIVTASDLNKQLETLSEPFLALSEIENTVRDIIRDRFNSKELTAACDPSQTGRSVDTVDQMNFGEYIRLLQAPDNWVRLGFHIDRAVFCEYLDEVRKIRNEVMHFDPDGIGPSARETLRTFKSFLSQLQDVYAQKA